MPNSVLVHNALAVLLALVLVSVFTTAISSLAIYLSLLSEIRRSRPESWTSQDHMLWLSAPSGFRWDLAKTVVSASDPGTKLRSLADSYLVLSRFTLIGALLLAALGLLLHVTPDA